MTKQTIALATLPASLLFMMLAYWWPTDSPALSGWTDEDSKRMGEIQNKVHGLRYGVHSHGPPKPGEKPETHDQEAHRKTELAEMEKKFAEENAKLESARGRGSFMVKLFTGLSVVTFVVGIAGIAYLTVLEQQQNQK